MVISRFPKWAVLGFIKGWEYIVCPVYITILSHRVGSHTCGIRPYVRGWLHMPDTWYSFFWAKGPWILFYVSSPFPFWFRSFEVLFLLLLVILVFLRISNLGVVVLQGKDLAIAYIKVYCSQLHSLWDWF